MSEVKTKAELMSELREIQQKYSAVAAQLKELTFAEEKAIYEQRQLTRLEEYKQKYKFYASLKEEEPKAIDWEEVEKLVRSSFASYGKPAAGYSLGFDQSGMEGLGCDYGNNTNFNPMVEEASDIPKYIARETRRQEFIDRAKQKK